MFSLIDAQTTTRAPVVTKDALPKDLAMVPPTVGVEGNCCLCRRSNHAHHRNPFPVLVDRNYPVSPTPPVQPGARPRLMKSAKNLRPQTASVLSIPRITAPREPAATPFPRIGRHNCEQAVDAPVRGGRTRKNATPAPRGWEPPRAIPDQGAIPRKNEISTLWGREPRTLAEILGKALGKILPIIGSHEIYERPLHCRELLDVENPARPEAPPLSPVLSTHHGSDPSNWKYVISGLIDAIFSDSDKVKAIGNLRGDDAQIFTDMVYEVYLCSFKISSPKATLTNFLSGFRSGTGVPRSRPAGKVFASFVQDLWSPGPTSEITGHPILLGSGGSTIVWWVGRCVGRQISESGRCNQSSETI